MHHRRRELLHSGPPPEREIRHQGIFAFSDDRRSHQHTSETNIQAFPGPNFNFAVYLGALSTIGVSGLPAAAGAVLGFVGIFAPGLLVSAGLMGVWARLRSKRWLRSFLRGVNALAIGLVFTAVHKLWQIGLINQRHDAGAPLGSDPWWVVITAASFVGGRYFDMPAVAAILAGGAMGLLWFAAVRT